MSNLNINQFAQQAVRGQLDLQLVKQGILSGRVSDNEVGSIKVGDDVIIDAAITDSGIPQFKKALFGEIADGFMIQDPKASTVQAGEIIQVAFRFYGPIMWLVAGATVTPGSFVEQLNSTTLDVQNLAAGKLRGKALDYAVSGQLTRVICGAWPVV